MNVCNLMRVFLEIDRLMESEACETISMSNLAFPRSRIRFSYFS